MDNINFNELPGNEAIDIGYRNKNMRYFLYSCRELGYEITSFRKTQYNLSKEIKTTDVFEYCDEVKNIIERYFDVIDSKKSKFLITCKYHFKNPNGDCIDYLFYGQNNMINKARLDSKVLQQFQKIKNYIEERELKGSG